MSKHELNINQRKKVKTAGGAYVGRDVHARRDFIGRDRINIHFHLASGIRRVSSDYAGRIQNFLTEYIGTPEQPVPFGGRDAEIASLDKWLLDEEAPPYALIAATAGRGKSALLTRWAWHVAENKWAHVAYIPISIRFGTASEILTFQTLAAQLAVIYEEPLELINRPAREWQEVYLSFLQRTPPAGKPLVVIIDGLDEATGEQAGPNLMPLAPPFGVRAIVSARCLSGNRDEGTWLRRLGWDRPGLARSFSLHALTWEGVSDVLRAMGHPLDRQVTNVDIISELYRLSGGDPLLVRLYVDALLPYGENQVIDLQPEDLPHIDEGIAGYFERWWEDQEQLWQKRGEDPLREKEGVETFFNLCANALGPLSRDDVAQLAPEIGFGMRLRRVAAEVSRFIIGNGSTEMGYVFSHPHLAQYFREGMSVLERKSWEGRFIQYGQATIKSLVMGELEPEEASSYLVRHFSDHLDRNGASFAEMVQLTSPAWYHASEKITGSHSNFLNDISWLWRHAAKSYRLESDVHEGQVIGLQVRCALITASLRSLIGNIPPLLLASLVEAGNWSPMYLVRPPTQFSS